MKTTLMVFGIIGIILGGFAILNSIFSYDVDAGYAFIGGCLFLANGIIEVVASKNL
jgi:uncharacterized membrane protein HdeD (DUF308 family)